ncbi:MAG: TPM domain-containing protein [Rhodobacteraceae bacterium]|nr:TPM domain-containing protein [Paracoccaceae bacterium]
MIRMLAIFLCLAMPLQAKAQVLPDPLSDTVSDFADLLPPDSEARVTAALTKGRADTGVHVVLVTMMRIADHGGANQRIEDYAKTLFNQWGVGDASRNDGILILVAKTDREMRIALGSGYQVISDNAAQRVIDRYFLPAFRDDRYAEGIEAGIQATYDLIALPFAAGADTPPTPKKTWQDFAPMAIFGLFFAGIAGLIARSVLADVLVRVKACPNCGKRRLSRTREVLQDATTTTVGTGLLHTHCAACGWDRSERYSISRISDDTSSSGGFGGGSSSGGGASGRW